MSSLQRKAACTALAQIWHQLLSLRFDTIGSLHIDSKDQISIGPIVVPNCQAASVGIENPVYDKCGPLATVRDWLVAVARHDVRFKHPKSPRQLELMAAAIRQIETSPLLSSCPTSPMDENLVSTLVLLHVDLCPRNVLVSPTDPTVIAAVIDWEGAHTTPIWTVHPVNILSPTLVDGLGEWNDAADQKLEHENMTPEQFFWSEIERLNAEWARASAGGKDFRNLYITARCSSMESEDFEYE
ncbi:hypothetical protein DFH06DRAFT_1180415 [Mycena polygramma]|nr:hypothetical protein DFH06DRAFT_1180415 [Mycena polygramma]